MRALKITQKITQRDVSDSFKKYLQEVSNIKPFESPNEEYDCAIKAHNGDIDAKFELIQRNLRFVISVAKKYQQGSSSLQDLVNCGNIGLIEAANRFDPTRGFKFISYGVWWIRKTIIEHINNELNIIRVPINKMNNIQTLKRVSCSLEQKEERDIFGCDMLEYNGLNLSDREIMEYDYITNIVINSLDAKMSSSCDDSYFIDMFEDVNSLRPDSSFDKEDMVKCVNGLISKLKPKEIKVISHFFGLNDYKLLTLQEIAKEMGITSEGVRLIRNKVLKKIHQDVIKSGYDLNLFNIV